MLGEGVIEPVPELHPGAVRVLLHGHVGVDVEVPHGGRVVHWEPLEVHYRLVVYRRRGVAVEETSLI